MTADQFASLLTAMGVLLLGVVGLVVRAIIDSFGRASERRERQSADRERDNMVKAANEAMQRLERQIERQQDRIDEFQITVIKVERLDALIAGVRDSLVRIETQATNSRTLLDTLLRSVPREKE